MQPSVSVIVPVYNIEQYIGKCLDSIIGQTLKEIEIIVVDDGSTDDSSRIIDRYARTCLLYTSPSPRDRQKSRMPSSA